MGTSESGTFGRTVPFSGRSWAVKRSNEPVGPGPNLFSDGAENVWVDADARLHLRITQRGGRWRCAEVILDRSLGHGSYRFSIASNLAALDRNVVLGLFIWSDDPAHNNTEIDIEFARRLDPSDSTNAQYVVQPAERSGHLRRFTQPRSTEPTTHGFVWAGDHVAFQSTTARGRPISSWDYVGSDVPPPGGEHARINLWLQGGLPPSDGHEVEVVLTAFSFRGSS